MTDIAEERDALARALYDVLYTLHPVYPSTTGPRGGIGGAAMTPWCHITDPYSNKFQDVYDRAESILHYTFRLADEQGRDPDLLRGTR